MVFQEMKAKIGDNSYYYKSRRLAICLYRNRKEVYMAKKVTSAKVASKASKALSDGRSSARTKSIAGSALSQREKGGKRK